MATYSPPAPHLVPGAPLAALALLWLSGLGARVTILAVGPLIPRIHHDLGLSPSEVGLLAGLPIVTFALTSVFGALLVARLGARTVLVLGLALVALAGAARGIGPSAAMLFLMSLLMGLGGAVIQPTLAMLARLWWPARPGPAAMTYANGMFIGQIVAAGATLPLLLPLLGGSWELALAAWSAPVALTALLVLLCGPREARVRDRAPVAWMPDWRSGLTWRFGLLLGGSAITYYASNAFIPEYLTSLGTAGLVPPALTALNVGQLPASVLVAVFPARLVGQRWPCVAAGCTILASIPGLLLTGGLWVLLWAALLGFSSGLLLSLTLALIPSVADPRDISRLSAGIFTICYGCGFLGSLASGVLWDVSGVPAAVFVPVLLGSIGMLVLPPRVVRPAVPAPA